MPPSSTRSDTNDLLATVRRTLTKYPMLAAGDRVLVGVSGGPDSMVLLHLLNHLAPGLKLRLGVAHLNHCLRGNNAERDAQTVKQVADRLNLPCYVGSAHVMKVKNGLKLSLEEASRRVRYAFYKKIMQQGGYNKLALGHHLDDNAEQMLMALLRGTGPKGLSGILPVRGNRLVRPLIEVRRSQIDTYAKANGIAWVADASNQDLRFVRNRIRHRLLPILSSDYNPRIQKQLSQLADVMRTEDEWIEALITETYVKAKAGQEKNGLAFKAEALRRMHPALLRRLVRRALLEVGGTLRRIGFTHIQAVQELVEKRGTLKTLHLPRGIRISLDGDRLRIVSIEDYPRCAGGGHPDDSTTAPIVIHAPFPRQITSSAMGIGMTLFACPPDQLPPLWTIPPHQAFFDLNRLTLPLILRPKLPGDRFTPLGSRGSQKVKKYFIDHRIPRCDRLKTPVLSDQRQIIWLVGHRIDDRIKVTSATTQALGAEFYLLDS